MRIPDGQIDPDLVSDIDVLTRKAGLTPWHARALRALECIADYYATVPAARVKKGAPDA